MAFTENTQSVVIGGSSGIGAAIVELLRQKPGQVHVASRRNGVDASKSDSLDSYFARLGKVDHLFFTAGSQAPGGALPDLDLAAAQQAFSVKFWGALVAIKTALPSMRGNGSITLTSGFLARRAIPGTLVKTAMNAALEASVKVMARDFAPIRVNCVSPGLTQTPAYAGMGQEQRNRMMLEAAQKLPTGRVATARDIASGFVFAAENPAMTGAVIDIENGALIA